MIATMGNVFYFDWEFDLLYWFQGLHNPVLDKIVVAITSLGNAGIFWILLTIAMLIFCKDGLDICACPLIFTAGDQCIFKKYSHAGKTLLD